MITIGTRGSVICLGLLLSTPPSSFSRTQHIGPTFDTLHGSMYIDLPLRWSRGEVAGRDFIFTYGPLYQILHSPWLFGTPGDVASILRFHALLVSWGLCLGLWLVLTLTKMPMSRRVPTFLLWILLMPPYAIGFKPMAAVYAFFLWGYSLFGISSFKTRWRNLVVPILFSSAIVPALVLYTFDLGLIASIVIAFMLTGLTCFSWRLQGEPPRYCRRLLLTAATSSTLGTLAFIVLMLSWQPFHGYLPLSWEVASGYTAAMAAPCSMRSFGLICLVFGAASALVFFLGFRLRSQWQKGYCPNAQTVGFFAVACFCAIWVRYGLTRSDSAHLQSVAVPTVFAISCLLPGYVRVEYPEFKWPFIEAWVPLFVLSTQSMGSILSGLETIKHCQVGPSVLVVENPFAEASRSLQKLPGESVYIWPFEAVIGQIAGKRNADFTLQSYCAHTDNLQQQCIDRLKRIADLPVILVSNTPIFDDIEYYSRTSMIFRYLLEEFALAETSTGNFMVLKRSPGRKSQWREVTVMGGSGTLFPSSGVPLHIKQDDAPNRCRASDVMVLEIQSSAVVSFGITKPGVLKCQFILSDGQLRTQTILVPPDGKRHEVLVSACKTTDPLFLSLFHPYRLWRAKESIVAIELAWVPLDMMSRQPEQIEVYSLRVLRRDSKDVMETSLAEQDRDGMRGWCYGVP